MTRRVLLWLADKVTRIVILLAVLALCGLYNSWAMGWL